MAAEFPHLCRAVISIEQESWLLRLTYHLRYSYDVVVAAAYEAHKSLPGILLQYPHSSKPCSFLFEIRIGL